MGYIFFNKTKFYSHPIYDSYYASKKGEIYSSKSNKILKLGTHTNGYLFFIIFNKTKTKNYLVHRYVFECLCGSIPKDKVVVHIDNNMKNNRIDNLQLLSQKENLNKCRCKNKTKEIQINVTIVNICIYGGKREEIYKLNKKIIIINDLHKRRNRKIFRNIKKLQ